MVAHAQQFGRKGPNPTEHASILVEMAQLRPSTPRIRPTIPVLVKGSPTYDKHIAKCGRSHLNLVEGAHHKSNILVETRRDPAETCSDLLDTTPIWSKPSHELVQARYLGFQLRSVLTAGDMPGLAARVGQRVRHIRPVPSGTPLHIARFNCFAWGIATYWGTLLRPDVGLLAADILVRAWTPVK